eukprot:Selendium_serpulae@DN5124_c0_g1_i1.p1
MMRIIVLTILGLVAPALANTSAVYGLQQSLPGGAYDAPLPGPPQAVQARPEQGIVYGQAPPSLLGLPVTGLLGGQQPLPALFQQQPLPGLFDAPGTVSQLQQLGLP